MGVYKIEYLKTNNAKPDLIDLSNNTSLKKIYIENSTKLIGLEALEDLESIIVSKPNDALLRPDVFNNLRHLEHLTIANADLTKGLGFLKSTHLRSLFLYGLKYIDFTGIEEHKLSTLWVEKCKAAENCGAIYSSNTISELKIIDSFNIPSADLLSGMLSLNNLVVMGKSIFEDGDLSPLMLKLKHFGFDNKRHYSITFEEFKNNFLRTNS